MRGNGPWLALDVGGANLKGAHSSGSARSVPFALWKQPEALVKRLRSLVEDFPPFERVAATMTGELCDCFATKAEGVRTIVGALERAFAGRVLRIWGIDGRFHDPDTIRGRPGLAAAANWLALATEAARWSREGSGLLIDIGSTTTDFIPLRGGRPVPSGRTDAERLRSGELVYAGVRRTPVCALATELDVRGIRTGLAAELFATTLDVYLTLGALTPDPDDHDTADGRPATVEAARGRLARMVGDDADGFSAADAAALARSADAALVARLTAAARKVGDEWPGAVIVAGSGSWLAQRVARQVAGDVPIMDLEQMWGPAGSAAACARALLGLAESRDEVG